MNKVLLVIGDGMGDAAYNELGKRTPLAISKTPNLDRLASSGISGMLYPVGQGKVPSSMAAHRAILGDRDFENTIGRGLFAAMASGIQLETGDIAFRCDLSTVVEGIVIDERAGRIKDTSEIQNYINGLSPIDGIEFEYRAVLEYRGALVIRNRDRFKGFNVSDIFSFEGKTIQESVGFDENSKDLARFINKLYYRVQEMLHTNFKASTANAITLRGASQHVELESSILLEKDIKGAFVTALPDVFGVLKFCGLTPLVNLSDVSVKNINKEEYINPILDNFEQFDLFVINIGSFDAAGHDGDLRKKVELFEELDAMIGYYIENTGDSSTIIITADHSTLCSTKQHSVLPVPLVVSNTDNGFDQVKEFSEEDILLHGILGNISDGTVVANLIAANLGKGVYIA